MIQFDQLVSVNFQGVVVVFGRPAQDSSTDIYFNVLGSDSKSNDDSLNWTGFRKLEFTEQVRQVGMSIITVERAASTMAPSSAPFRVVTDQKYISVVQQSEHGTLYINRFRLLKTESGSDEKEMIYNLSPAWEVRYSRSHKEDVPADKSDTQGYLDPDGYPFLEPSLELSMVDAVKNGDFEVFLLPSAGGVSFSWQFITLNQSSSELNFFNFPASENGLFDVTGKSIGSNYEILPDSSCSIVLEGTKQPLPLKGAPRAAVYTKHEKVVQPDGSNIGVKRASRVMITQTVEDSGATATATIDSAVGTGGTIAKLAGPLEASKLEPSEFDLEFNGVSYLTLNPPGSGDNPLAIKGPYTMGFMIAARALGDNVPIIGGDDAGDPKTAAPFVKIVDGGKLEVGFGNGAATVQCRTLHQVLFPDVWSTVEIEYAGAGDNPFTISINGSLVAISACTTDAEPSGTPVSTIGAAKGGFAGALNAVNITVGGTSVVELPCDTVDYTVDPPTTPNTASSGITATVFGAKNEPSSSPVNINMSGTFHIDEMGLTYYTGIADFIVPNSPTCLIEGSDGLLHLYYQGKDNLFSVAQFSTGAARSTFYTAWTTKWGPGSVAERHAPEDFHRGLYLGRPTTEWHHVSTSVLAADDKTQAGFLNFVAHRVGTYMDGTKITITSSSVSPLLCDVSVVASQDVGTETWQGLPRNIDQMSVIWNGAGSNSPDAQGVVTQKKPYFDYSGSVPAVLCPTGNDSSGAFFLITSVPRQPVDLASVEITAGASADFVDVDVESTAPPNWQPTDTIKQSWPAVPADPRSVLDVFACKASHYDYGGVTTPGTRAYGLAVTTARSDDQVNHVVVFVKDELKDFTITIEDGSKTQTCNVTICGMALPDVPRAQDSFAEVINGLSQSYSYPSGYKTDVAAKVFALANGLTADVVNSSGPPDSGDAFAYAGLLRVLFQGNDYDAANIAPLAATDATVFQSATLTFNGRTDPIPGSMLFGAVIVDPPTDGGIGKLSNTSSYSGGNAPILAPGVNGGWMPVPPKFSIDLNAGNGTNYVSFDVDKSFAPSDRLAILSDLTAEAWLYQKPSKTNVLSRALTYNVTGNREHPTLPAQYMLGSKRGPGLITGTSTFATSSFNFLPPNLTVQIYVKRPNASSSGTVLSVSEVMGGSEFISLSVDGSGKPVLSFLKGAGTVTGDMPLPENAWVCLTATVADAGDGKVTLSLYVDAGAPASTTVGNTFQGDLGTLTIGAISGAIAASLNGAAFWQRALTTEEVQNSFNYGFPDNDALLGIRWNLAEGTGTKIMNSAATGPEYDAVVINPVSPSWDEKGAFDVPYAGRNDLIIASNRILKGWTQVALASSQGHGLKLNGSESGTVKDGSPFNPGDSFAIEAWITPNSLNSKQIIVEKPGSYSLYINTLGQVCLTVTVSQNSDLYDLPPVVFTREIKGAIKAGETSYIAVNFTTGATDDKKGSDKFVQQKFYVYSSLFVNGANIANENKDDYTKSVAIENDTSSFYLGVAGDETFNFEGLVSHVRVWNRTLTEPEIKRTYAFRSTPTNLDGLTAGWDFDDMTGMVAKSITGNNDLQLSSNQLWTIWQDVAQASIYVNGRSSLPLRLTTNDVGGYEDTQFTFGGAMQGSTLTSPFVGELDDVRLFSTLLTEQQVREAMNKALTGTEDNLAAYWMIDAGSGTTLFDITGHGNNGTMLPAKTPPTWETSSAPIQNEGEYVVNALGGQANYLVAQIEGQPAVSEYATAETDAYGKIFSVMKRGYFYRTSVGNTELEVGYKVGDLDTIFVGQVQSKPSIIGYIEGGPPIPSENQTLAYWWGDQGGPARLYSNVSTATYQESETKTWSFSAKQSSTFNGAFNIKGGFYLKSKTSTSVGLGAEAETQVLENKIKLGLKATVSGDIGGTDEVAQSHSNSVSLSTTMTPAGTWEPADDILNLTVGRRYIQNNVGIALVKSATADLFMMALKGTQTPVGYTIVPNETIPVDTNIIDFPINPKYVKNGTLDGKVGLVNDPDYPGADEERGSYFKPLEAYATKRKIEKEEQQIKAYYDQFEVNKYRVIGSLDRVKDKLKENIAYDFSNQKNLRSIFCNYVWTAVGGLHKEEHSVANSYSETYVGASSLKVGGGFEISADIGTPFGGYYVEADAMLGNTWTMTATKSEATANGFRLACTVSPTDFLPAPIIETDAKGQLVFKGYNTTAAPGKVDGYRYMAFQLAPSEENFLVLNSVVDQNWLNNSTTAAANAMREAMLSNSEPWRVMYRTTYVSRVPAPFQPVKDDTSAPNIVPPANLPSNYWLVKIIGDQISKADPTPLEIGTAIDVVLGDKSGPGILKNLIPWWADFYAAAQEYGTEEFLELAELRVDLLDYMVSKYAAEKYMLG